MSKSDDLKLPEGDLIRHSQSLKGEMAALRERRGLIARELERREEDRVADAQLAALSVEARRRLAARLKATDADDGEG